MIRMYCIILVSILNIFFSVSFAQNKIVVDIDIDTMKWAPVAYLSLIPDFNHLNTISYSQIIEECRVTDEGLYKFSTEYLPEEERLYRIHFSKKGDPPASLIIGGRDQNYLYFFASRNSKLTIDVTAGKKLINDIHFRGYATNLSIHYLSDMIEAIDSIDRMGTSVNSDYALQTVYGDIKSFADTCPFPLLSLYAIYNTDFESDFKNNPAFYRRYMRKQRSEKSVYFKEFRKRLRGERKRAWYIIIPIVLITGLAIPIYLLYKIRKKKNRRHPLSELTIQERKILELMKEGKSNKEIADECSVSISTVKSHISSIYSKLNIKTRKEIAYIDIG